MQTWDTIRARRNVRTHEDTAIPAQDLEWILEAARREMSLEPIATPDRRPLGEVVHRERWSPGV
jgi:hypothetical protein